MGLRGQNQEILYKLYIHDQISEIYKTVAILCYEYIHTRDV